MELKGSRTEKNLLTAFAGESQARNRYSYFSSQARKEGYVQIAGVFEETADQEKEHAKRLFKLLQGGDVEIAAAAADPECALLETMPSVGPFTALLVKAEVADISRFSSSKQLVSYCGLAPRVNQSGERCTYGRLGPIGNSRATNRTLCFASLRSASQSRPWASRRGLRQRKGGCALRLAARLQKNVGGDLTPLL